MVGHPGVAPGLSPIRTARIAVFLVPQKLNRVKSEVESRDSHPDPRHAVTLSCF